MDDILVKICSRREKDYKEKGKEFGCSIPAERMRPVVPFLASPGAILEIKRSSPSKGMINADLDPVSRAASYRASGAKQISILTENNYFGGSLDDLIAVGGSIDDVALLRKDFIQHPEEIEVSYRAGADAVLLICAVLDSDTLQACADECSRFGITPLIEVRDIEDVHKLNNVVCETKIAGINSRNLSTFHIDPLRPARLFSALQSPAVYESGIHHPGMCTYARSLGFRGVLIGESVSRDEAKAPAFVNACAEEGDTRQGDFWKRIATLRVHRPLIKICGLTNAEDAEAAVTAGADLLGAVFAKSEREADEASARKIRETIDSYPSEHRPLFIGVVTETEGGRFSLAEKLYEEGVLDALQYHEVKRSSSSFPPGYHALRLKDQKSVANVREMMRQGEPRVLVDGFKKGMAGGSGVQVESDLLDALGEDHLLWLAGGLSKETVGALLKRYQVELADASSSLEVFPGKKDHDKVRKFIQECRS